MSQDVLALNAGSSTLKFACYRFEAGRETELSKGNLAAADVDTKAALARVLEHLATGKLGAPAVVGHRLVHGGRAFTAPVIVDDAVLGQLRELEPLAPLHLPPALQLLRAGRQALPRACHVACFDTAFHHSLPEVASRLPLPLELQERGIRRYGFHGLSYEYVRSQLGTPPPARLIVAHLGSGASLAAIRDGKSIDTTMGLTPSGGIPMGTRSGDLDPGVLLHLLREQHYSVEQLEQLINHESGLKGMGGSADMTTLLARAAEQDQRALGAIHVFAYAIKKQIGAYFAALGGLDCLVFTGGIGENAPLVRHFCCAGLAELGIELEPALNAANAPLLSRPQTRCAVRVIPTNEDLIIARSAYTLARVGKQAPST